MLHGTWYPSSSNIENTGKDPDDFAYLILPSETYNELMMSGYEFITLNNLDGVHQRSFSKTYAAVGFKWKKTKRKGIDLYSTM